MINCIRKISIAALTAVGLLGFVLGICLTLPTPSQASSSPPPSPSIVAPAISYTVFLPIISKPQPSASPDWLATVNFYRSLANLPDVTENSSYSDGAWKHARYMVKNDFIGHTEDPGNPWYTPEGLKAAQSSNLAVFSNINTTDEAAVAAWMDGPFHALGVLDPALKQVGFGSYRENIGLYRVGAALNVIQGLGSIPSGTKFPIFFPADGTKTPLSTFTGESPSPLSSCPGYSTPTGPNIILQIGDGSRTPNTTAHSFLENGVPKPHCIFDETTYHHNDSSSQSLGRNILNSRDAVVVMPRYPLKPGAIYSVSITVNGQTYTWSFEAL